MLVTEFCNNRGGDLPDEFYDCLPKFCSEDNCDFPMEIGETLTQLQCSNPRCPSKVIKRLMMLGEMIGINLDEGLARKLIEKFSVLGCNPLYIFGYSPAEDGVLEGVSLDRCYELMDQINRRKQFTLEEYIRVANLPYIQSSIRSIFSKYDSLEDAYRDIEEGGVWFIQSKLGLVYEDSLSIRALKVYEILLTFKEDLFDAIEFVKIVPINSGNIWNIRVVCVDTIGGSYRGNTDFYAEINNMFHNIHVDFLDFVDKDIDYVIWSGSCDGEVPLNVRKAEEYNRLSKVDVGAKGSAMIHVVTLDNFLNILEERDLIYGTV